MLGLSRWAGKGCSYRTVQRFFGEQISWAQLYRSEREYLLAGDESVITKSGKKTYGLDHFFSGLLNQKVVPSIAIFALSLIDVTERRSYPIRVEQVIRSEAEKAAAKAKKQPRKAKQKAQLKGKPGRPKGSKNRDKTQVELNPELLLQRRQTILGPRRLDEHPGSAPHQCAQPVALHGQRFSGLVS